MTYADVMRTCRQKVDLTELGIEELGLRRAVTGGIILEIPGEGASDRANLLAEEFRRMLDAGNVRVSRPMRCAELRIRGFDESMPGR